MNNKAFYILNVLTIFINISTGIIYNSWITAYLGVPLAIALIAYRYSTVNNQQEKKEDE